MFARSPEGGRFRVPTLLERQWSTTRQELVASPWSCRVDRSSRRSQAHARCASTARLRATSQPTESRLPSNLSRRDTERSATPGGCRWAAAHAPLCGRCESGHAPRIARLHDPHAPPISRAQVPRIRLLGRTGADAPVLDRGSRGTGEIVSARVCQTCGRVLNAEHRLDRAQVAAEFGLGRAEAPPGVRRPPGNGRSRTPTGARTAGPTSSDTSMSTPIGPDRSGGAGTPREPLRVHPAQGQGRWPLEHVAAREGNGRALDGVVSAGRARVAAPVWGDFPPEGRGRGPGAPYRERSPR